MTQETILSDRTERAQHNATPKVVVFACKWCALIGADAAGKNKVLLPVHFRVIPVECASRVEADAVIRAFSSGIDGVAVMGCHLGGCRYNNANHRAAKRLELLRPLLDTVGIDSRRLFTSFGTAHEHHQFADVIGEFYHRLQDLPPVAAWSRPFMNDDGRGDT
jgi:coenzyme F420-reducing hydrogenase delta subunit